MQLGAYKLHELSLLYKIVQMRKLHLKKSQSSKLTSTETNDACVTITYQNQIINQIAVCIVEVIRTKKDEINDINVKRKNNYSYIKAN